MLRTLFLGGAVLFGAALQADGVFMLVSPESWYFAVPGVTSTGPFQVDRHVRTQPAEGLRHCWSKEPISGGVASATGNTVDKRRDHQVPMVSANGGMADG